jgi:tetratricopeptide (TPR) repeat protein
MKRYLLMLCFVLANCVCAQVHPGEDKQRLKDSAHTLHQKAVECSKRGSPEDLREAIGYWSQSADIYDSLARFDNVGLVYSNIGVMFQRLGDPVSELAALRRCLSAFAITTVPEQRASACRRIGSLLSKSGHPDSALAYSHEALDAYRQLGDRTGEAMTLDDIGRTYYTIGRFELALDFLNQACVLFALVDDQLGLTSARLQIYSIELAISNKLLAVGKTDSGLAKLQRTLKGSNSIQNLAVALQEMRNRNIEGEGTGGSGLSNQEIDLLMKNTRSGEPEFVMLWALRLTAVKFGSRQEEANALSYIADYLVGKGEVEDALAYYDSALTMQHRISDVWGASKTLTSIARAYHRYAMPCDIPTALLNYEAAARSNASVVARAGEDANRVSMAEQDTRLYGEWVLACLSQAGRVGDQNAILSALAASERGRAQAMLSLMRSTNEAIPADKECVQQGVILLHAVRNSRSTILDYLITADTLVVWIIPPAGDVKLYRKALSSESLAKQAQRESARVREGALAQNARQSLSGLVAAARSTLGAADARALTRSEGSSVNSEPVLLEPYDAITQMMISRNAVPIDAVCNGRDRLRELSAIVLPAEVRVCLPAAGELVVVPHGSLNMVPFAALPLGDSDVVLGERYAIRYSPSLQALVQVEKHPSVVSGGRKTVLQRSLIIGNPSMPKVTTSAGMTLTLSSLPGADEEGRWLANYSGAEALSGSAASETEFRKRAATSLLIHLATHGYAFAAESRSRESFIALAPDAANDGLLTVGEVIDCLPKLCAELVVLSACQTGLGNIQEAEGTVGLQRAFLAKGGRSVLVSLWNVSDQATLLLMKSFYQHWLEDGDQPSKADALRRAQGDVRSASGFEHPRYWAAFQLVGAN